MLARLAERLGLKTELPVFATSAALILGMVVFAGVFTDAAQATFGTMQSFISGRLGWLYVACVNIFLGFCIWICCTRYGSIRLGRDSSRPKYRNLTWVAMLFTAGMGIGVLFWSVAEPVTHFAHPPAAEPGSAEAAREAMHLTFLHWGLHGWAVYAVVGLPLAYFGYRHGQPLALRSAFYPLLGERTHGAAGHAIDIFAVLGTMFGVATTLGLGVQQIGAGIEHLTGFETGLGIELLLIAGITGVAIVSVVQGLDKGVRRLSELALAVGALMVLYILVVGPTGSALAGFVKSTGYYLLNVIPTAVEGPGDAAWQGDWTLFYWAWWISWSPFVGLFVARVSAGRTIREFVLGVLLLPVGMTFFWYAIFGTLALDRIQAGDTSLVTAVDEAFPAAIFVFLDGFPLASVLSIAATFVIVLFFVTSSDSASLVIDYLTSGQLETPARQRVFWACVEGLVAGALLVAGGLQAMRSFQLATGIAICFIVLLMCFALVKTLRREEPPG